MAAYNAERYLRDAIDSILGQSFADFEFVIVDDGSTDATAEIIHSYWDPRIIVLANESNLGQTRSVNRGLRIARGEYIARMDADDVSEPARLLMEVEYLDTHPEVAVVATWAHIVNGDFRGAEVLMTNPNPGVLAWELSWKCTINQSSVLIRRTALEEVGLYDARFRYIEDYKLWTDLIKAGRIISVLPRSLNWRRLWPDQISVRHSAEQEEEHLRAAHGYVEWLLGRDVGREDVRGMIALYVGHPREADEDMSCYFALAREIEDRCAELYGGIGAREIRDLATDALIYGAASALRNGGLRQARRGILSALGNNPLRAARPKTFRLLASSFVNGSRQ